MEIQQTHGAIRTHGGLGRRLLTSNPWRDAIYGWEWKWDPSMGFMETLTRVEVGGIHGCHLRLEELLIKLLTCLSVGVEVGFPK